MYSVDFEYDGKRLSDFNGMLCNIGGSSDTISFGVEVTWNTVKIGNTFVKTSATYDNAYGTVLQFAKNNCSDMNDYYFTDSEIIYLERWLIQKKYKKFKLIYDDDSFTDIYFNATFTNITPMMQGGKVIGFELTLTTDAPFAHYEEKTYSATNTTSITIHDLSTEVCEIYPKVEITCKKAGTLYLSHSGGTTKIENVSADEVITFSGMTKQISSSTHSTNPGLYNDFNYVYPKIKNYIDDNGIDQVDNTFSTTNMPIDITIAYSPIAKVGII